MYREPRSSSSACVGGAMVCRARPRSQRRRRRRRGTALDRRLEARADLCRGERLADECDDGRESLERLEDRRLIRGHQDDRHLRGAGVVREQLTDLRALEIRQQVVEQDHVGSRRARTDHAVASRRRKVDIDSGATHRDLDELAECRAVIDDEHPRCVHRTSTTAPANPACSELTEDKTPIVAGPPSAMTSSIAPTSSGGDAHPNAT